MNGISYFEIQATEPEKLVVFYNNVFGWRFTRDKTLPIEYYRIETEGIRGGLLASPFESPPLGFKTNAFICSVNVNNFDKTAKLILKNNGRIALPKFAIHGKCWQGYFIDTADNTFGIFQIDKSAK